MSKSENGPDSQNTPKSKGKRRSADTQERLADALRANLHRRKTQERARNSTETAKKP